MNEQTKSSTGPGPGLQLYDKTEFEMYLGRFPADNENIITPLTGALEELFGGRLGRGIFQELYRFMGLAIQERVIRDYHAGAISPGLAKLLEMELPPWKAETMPVGSGEFKSWRALVNEMIQAGKADFSPFKGPQDTRENWLFRYSITPFILSLHMRDSIMTTERNLPERKAEAAQALRGTLAAALDETAPETYRRGPIKEDVLSRYAEALKMLYSIRTGAESELHFVVTERPAFYMNPETGQVFDLRPYAAEITHLMAPISWDYIKDYVKVIIEYLTERNRKGTQLLGPAEFLAIKNTPESTAISTLTTGYSEIFVQGTIFPDETTDYTTEIHTNQKDPARQLQIKINTKQGSRGPRPSTMKLKILLEMLFTQCGHPFFSFNIDQYMMATLPPGKEPTPAGKKKFKQKLYADLRLLKGMEINANYPGLPPGEIGILNDWVPGPGNTIEIGMDLVYCNHLRRGGLAFYPRGIFQIDEKFPHAIHFLEKLAQNRTSARNVRQGGTRPYTISLKALIDTDYSFLPLEKVQKTRKYKEAYIDPTVNTLVYLNESGYITSRYVNANHEEYTANDLSQVRYEDFIDRHKWLLEYDLIEYKDSPRLSEPVPERPKRKRKPRAKKTTGNE